MFPPLTVEAVVEEVEVELKILVSVHASVAVASSALNTLWFTATLALDRAE
jgi:hypothetical protein